MAKFCTIAVILTIYCSQLISCEPDYLKQPDVTPIADKKDMMLNDTITPSHYAVHLDLFTILTQEKVEKFNGKVTIKFSTEQKEVFTIELNQENIDFDRETVKIREAKEENPTSMEIADFKPIPENQKLLITLKKALTPKTDYIIELPYKARLYSEKEMRGLYKSYYFDNETNRRYIYTTHFGQQARRMLPCWDEPKYKAKFEISVNINKNKFTSVVSNAALKRGINECKDSKKDDCLVTFKETSKISTYHLALIVSDFDIKYSGEKNNFEVLARNNAIEGTNTVKELGPKLIKAFSDWTGVKYYDYADKMSMAAVPDFSPGGMENWGLIIHRESRLLLDDMFATLKQKQQTKMTTSHEISHMWFGDLVTCKWFDVTWLNEGFARYFQYIGLNIVEPSMSPLDQIYVDTVQSALKADSEATSHPLTSQNIYTYEEIRTMFSTISYDKGASILLMVHNMLGDTNFKKAISAYLNEHKENTATPSDLFKEFEKYQNGITEILELYTIQKGYPLVTVERKKDKFTFTQKKFLIDEKDHKDPTKWNVPISIAVSKDDFETVKFGKPLTKDMNKLEIDIKKIDLPYYIVNVKQAGFYRVNYDTENWKAIGKALKGGKDFGGIPPINRAQIIDDLFNLARVGYLKYDFIFDIIEYIKSETHYLPWSAFFEGFSFINRRMSNEETKVKSKYDEFMKKLIEPIYVHLKTKATTHLDKLNYMNVLKWAGEYKVDNATTFIKDKFGKVIQSKPEQIDSDIKPAVYCLGLKENADGFKTLWEMFNKSNHATEQETILKALGCTKKSDNIKDLLANILKDDIRYMDKSTAFTSAYTNNPENVDVVMQYILDNINAWTKQMNVVSSLGDLSNYFTTEKQFKTLTEAVESNKILKEGEKSELKKVIAKNQNNLKWDKERLPEIRKFVNNAGFNVQASLLLVFVASILRYFMY